MKKPKTGARRLAIEGRWVAVVIGMSVLTSCVQIDTPDKPIEINLNINVTQEVVYRLDNEAKSLIKQNPGIF